MTEIPSQPLSTSAGTSSAAPWHEVTEQAYRQRLQRGQGFQGLVEQGVEVESVLRFAAGAAPEVAGSLSNSPWARGRVAALLKRARLNDGDGLARLARETLAAAREGAALDPAKLVESTLNDAPGSDGEPLKQLASRLTAAEDRDAALAELLAAF